MGTEVVRHIYEANSGGHFSFIHSFSQSLGLARKCVLFVTVSISASPLLTLIETLSNLVVYSASLACLSDVT